MLKSSRQWVTGIILTITLLLAACDRQVIYAHYEQTPTSGWEKNDTVNFYISPVTEAGHYMEEIGIRIDDAYPFQGLCLVIQQTILPSGYKHNDTLNCKLFEQNGAVKGLGIRHYQYAYHINTLRLKEGDSLHIQVRHNMKREIMPGITDIGMKIKKQ